MFARPAPAQTSPALDCVAHSRSAARRWTARVAGSIAAGSLALTLVACSSGSSAASSTSSTPVVTPVATVTSTAVVTTNSTAVQTSTTTDTTTAVVTSTSVTTRTRDHTDTSTSSNTTAPTPQPIPCPSAQTLTALLAPGDRSVPVSDIACSGEWAIADYSQAGRNQVVGIFHYGTADGHWGLYPRNTACAATVNLPPSLYKRACTTS